MFGAGAGYQPHRRVPRRPGFQSPLNRGFPIWNWNDLARADSLLPVNPAKPEENLQGRRPPPAVPTLGPFLVYAGANFDDRLAI